MKKVLIIIGSLKKNNKGASEFLGNYLINLFHKKGVEAHKMIINEFLESGINCNDSLSIMDRSDIVIFSSPLYIDGPPYLVIKAMEIISGHCRRIQNTKKQRLMVISNGGYPESSHNTTAIAIYRQFALDAGFEWAGAFALGMGAALSVKLMRNVMLHSIKKSLKSAVDALLSDKPIPVGDIEKVARPFVPVWFYSLSARAIARYFAIMNKAGSIYDNPYAI